MGDWDGEAGRGSRRPKDGRPKGVGCRGGAATKEKARRLPSLGQSSQPACPSLPLSSSLCAALVFQLCSPAGTGAKLEKYLQGDGEMQDPRSLSTTKHPQCPSCNSRGEGHVGTHRHTAVDKVGLCRLPHKYFLAHKTTLLHRGREEGRLATEQKSLITAWSLF